MRLLRPSDGEHECGARVAFRRLQAVQVARDRVLELQVRAVRRDGRRSGPMVLSPGHGRTPGPEPAQRSSRRRRRRRRRHRGRRSGGQTVLVRLFVVQDVGVRHGELGREAFVREEPASPDERGRDRVAAAGAAVRRQKRSDRVHGVRGRRARASGRRRPRSAPDDNLLQQVPAMGTGPAAAAQAQDLPADQQRLALSRRVLLRHVSRHVRRRRVRLQVAPVDGRARRAARPGRQKETVGPDRLGHRQRFRERAEDRHAPFHQVHAEDGLQVVQRSRVVQ